MKIINKYLSLVIFLFVLSSCNGIDKLMKSRDYEKQYSEALRLYNIDKNNKAIILFSNIESIFQGTSRIDTIKFYTAKSFYKEGDYVISAELFDEFRKVYTRSSFAEEAEFLYAMSFFESSPNPELDQVPSTQGIEAFNEYLSRYPDSPKRDACLEMIEEMQGRLYDKAFIIANTYYNVGYYNSAIHSYENVLKTHPDIYQREEIVFLLVKANYLYAKSSIVSKQRERYLNTIDAYYNLISEYPESENKEEASRLFKISQKMANVDESYITGDSISNKITTRKIRRQENKIQKIADKANEQKIELKEERITSKEKKAQIRSQKSIAKKLAKIEAKIDKERLEATNKLKEEEKEAYTPTEISSTGSKVIKGTNTKLEDDGKNTKNDNQ